MLFLLSLSVVGLLIYAKPISYLIVSQLWPEEQLIEAPLGKATNIVGRVSRQSSQAYLGEAITNKNSVIRHRDRIIVGSNSKINFQLDNGYELELGENSEALFESWGDSRNNQVVYLTLLSGDYSLINSGKRGSLFIIKNKNIFAPEYRPKEKTTAVIQTPEAKSTDRKVLETNKKAVSKTDLPEQPEKQPENINKTGMGMPQKRYQESLDTQYIERILASRDQLFRRCRLTSLRDKKNNTGNLLYTFVIQPTGQVRSVRLLQSDVQNISLQNCVASVIERTKFKTFKGEDISLSYPIRFE